MKTEKLLLKYIEGYDILNNKLAKIPAKAIHYKPAPDKWSINEIIVHLADSEANGYIRAKKIIAESGTRSTVSEHQTWAAVLYYDQMNLKDALELIKVLRVNLHALLKLIDEEIWYNYIFHPDFGKITLKDWIQHYINHMEIHLEQINSNYQGWKKLNDNGINLVKNFKYWTQRTLQRLLLF